MQINHPDDSDNLVVLVQGLPDEHRELVTAMKELGFEPVAFCDDDGNVFERIGGEA
jgi:hypothetical protein